MLKAREPVSHWFEEGRFAASANDDRNKRHFAAEPIRGFASAALGVGHSNGASEGGSDHQTSNEAQASTLRTPLDNDTAWSIDASCGQYA